MNTEKHNRIIHSSIKVWDIWIGCLLFIGFLNSSVLKPYLPSIGLVYYLMNGISFFLLFRFPLRIPVLIHIMICVLSILNGKPPSIFQPWSRLLFYIFGLGLYGVLFNNSMHNYVTHLLWNLLLYLSPLLSLVSFATVFFPQSIFHLENGALMGLFNQPMMCAPNSCVAILLMLYLLLKSKSTKIKAWAIVNIITSISVVSFTGSRIAALALIVSISFFIAIQIISLGLFKKLFFIFLIGVPISYLLVYLYNNTEMFSLLKNKMELYDSRGQILNTRAVLWDNRLREFKSQPLLGIGFSSVDIITDTHYDGDHIEPGSSYLFSMSSTGLLGFISICCIIFYPFFNLLLSHNISIDRCLHIALLLFFYIHMSAEGYIFGAGNFLFIVFWIVISHSYLICAIDDHKLLSNTVSHEQQPDNPSLATPNP